MNSQRFTRTVYNGLQENVRFFDGGQELCVGLHGDPLHVALPPPPSPFLQSQCLCPFSSPFPRAQCWLLGTTCLPHDGGQHGSDPTLNMGGAGRVGRWCRGMVGTWGRRLALMCCNCFHFAAATIVQKCYSAKAAAAKAATAAAVSDGCSDIANKPLSTTSKIILL